MRHGISAVVANASGPDARNAAILTDEQILGLEPISNEASSPPIAQDAERQSFRHSERSEESLLEFEAVSQRDSSGNPGPRNDGVGDGTVEPAWLKSLDTQPEAAAEARRWRQAAMDATALDTAYFSAEPGARAALAARLHQTDPAAFRAMLADAARVLAERDPQGLADLAHQLGGASLAASGDAAPRSLLHAARSASSGTGIPACAPSAVAESAQPGMAVLPTTDASTGASPAISTFPADAYRAFESAVNDDVARQVRDSIDRTLSATLPDGIADGARRRIGEDIFRDLNAALSSDRELSAQIGQLLRGSAAGAGWRFDAATRQQLAGLLASRARTALPEVARRVVSEWTSSVLASDRIKQARIASAASRRDITGGRLPEPVASNALLPRRLDYNRTSDEQILEM